jgi:hypothetical protein
MVHPHLHAVLGQKYNALWPQIQTPLPLQAAAWAEPVIGLPGCRFLVMINKK